MSRLVRRCPWLAAAALAVLATPCAAVALTDTVATAASAATPVAAAHAPAGLDKRRALGLTGAPNFRDIGGYATTDGRHVRWGRVYRSSALNKLTADDGARVSELRLAAVIDLRTQEERTQAPTLWSSRPLDVYESSKPTLAPVMRTILGKAQTAAGAGAGMSAFYAEMPDTYRPEFAALFHRIAQGELPLLVHCTAGKDRTGVATALLLRSVGVPRRLVIQDYELTGILVPAPAMVTQGAAPTGGSAAQTAVAQLPAESRTALWESRGPYIEAALDAVDREYGSIDGYLTRGLGLSELEVRAVRRALTE